MCSVGSQTEWVKQVGKLVGRFLFETCLLQISVYLCSICWCLPQQMAIQPTKTTTKIEFVTLTASSRTFPYFNWLRAWQIDLCFFFLFLWCTSAGKRPTNKRYPMNLKNLTEANDDGTMKKCWIEFKSKINKRRNFHNTYHHFVASLFCV